MAQQARRSHVSSNIDRMQQEAVARVREMQQRASREESQGDPRYRNWSTDPNVQRQNRAPRREEPPIPPPDARQYYDEPRHPPQESARQGRSGGRRPPPNQQPRRGPAPPPPPPPPTEKKPKDTTLLQDILGAVGLDDDRILILGLILILINDKADTTLILALGYLLL